MSALMNTRTDHSLRFTVRGVGVLAAGLPDWRSAQAVFSGEQAYVASAMPPPVPHLLPANERRRAPLSVRLALAVAEQAVQHSGLSAQHLPSVFASSDADTHVIHRLMESLTTPERWVSPTDFHNCVHNVAAGYWSIAVGCQQPCNSLSADNASFVAGLLEALSQLYESQQPQLLVAFDVQPPEPLLATRPMPDSFGVALVLAAPEAGEATWCARLDTAFQPPQPITPTLPTLEALRQGNPAARALPFLQALHQPAEQRQPVLLSGMGYGLHLAPC